MRAELVCADLERAESDIRVTFAVVANHYFHVYSYPANSTLRASINAIADNWDGRTLRSFYALLYGYGPRTIGTWHPYEAEVFQRYYELRLAHRACPSPFDVRVLHGFASGEPQEQTVAELRAMTSVDVDSTVLENHRVILLRGDAGYYRGS